MCKNDPKVCELPHVLEDLVYKFAWNMPKEDVQRSLCTYIEIKEWKLPFWFFHNRIWSWHYNRYLDNPLDKFEPIEYYGGRFRELFNDDAVYCFLIGLDFRMKNVRMFGPRRLWEARLLNSWRVMDALSTFYKMLMRSKTRVLRQNTYDTFYQTHVGLR